MRTLLLIMLATISWPVAAEELQFTVSGFAGPIGNPGRPTIPFEVRFTLDTLVGTSSYSFSYPAPCLTAWQFRDRDSGPNVTNFIAILDGQQVINLPATVAEGNGGDPLDHCSIQNGSISMPPLVLGDIFTQNTRPLKLNAKDPLGDLLSHSICRLEGDTTKEACYFGTLSLGGDLASYQLEIDSLNIRRAHRSAHDGKPEQDDSDDAGAN